MSDFIFRLDAYSFVDSDANIFIDFPLAQEQINSAFKQLGIEDNNAMSVNFGGIDSLIQGFSEFLYDQPFEQINYLASIIQLMPDEERRKFATIAQNPIHCGCLKDAINLAYNLDCFEYLPEINTNGKYAERRQLYPAEEGWYKPPVITEYGCARMYANAHIRNYYNGADIPFRFQLPSGSRATDGPIVTVFWSENKTIFPRNYPINKADELFYAADTEKLTESRGKLFDRVSYEIGYMMKGEICYYPGEFEAGIEHGGLIDSIGRYNYGGESHDHPHKRPDITGAKLAEYLRYHCEFAKAEASLAGQIALLKERTDSADKFFRLANCHSWLDYYASCRYELNTSKEDFYVFPTAPAKLGGGKNVLAHKKDTPNHGDR